jgi:hypothetical protein
LVVPPCDDAALSAAMGRVVGDAALRARLAEGARRMRERLPTWDRAAEAMAFALTGFGTDDRVDS